MKKTLLILLILLTFNVQANASTNDITDTIKAIEINMFGYDYSNESDTNRITRIEKHLYGESKKGNINNRIKNIKNDTGFTVQKEPEKISKEKNIPEIKEDSSVEYPMVDKLEEEVFKTVYKNENIYTRLDRLEQKVFNQTSKQDLNTRVDKLASVIKPKKEIQREEYQYTDQDLNNYYRNNGLEPVNEQSIPFQLATLEQDILHNDYMNDYTSNRLNRLEKELFGRTFTNDSDTNRLQRIMVAYDAKKNSYKYENNRKMQNMATASQIGGFLLMLLAILL